jgi:hypothetical protein
VLCAHCRLIYAALFDLAGCVVSAKSGVSETSSSLSVSPKMPALNLCNRVQCLACMEAGSERGQFLAARLIF